MAPIPNIRACRLKDSLKTEKTVPNSSGGNEINEDYKKMRVSICGMLTSLHYFAYVIEVQ